MRKFFKKIHLWLSIPFGIVITIICLSGASLVFEQEIMEILKPNRYFVNPLESGKMDLNSILSSVSKSLPDSVKITSIEVPANIKRSYKVNLSKPRRAALFVNPYNGEVLDYNSRYQFFSTMFSLHRWLLNPPSQNGTINLGKTIVGISTLVFIIISITGFIIWFPRKLLTVKTNKGFRRFCYDFHVSTGFYTLFFVLLMAFTGLTWSFQWYRNGFYAIFGASQTQTQTQTQTQAQAQIQKSNKENFISWEKAALIVKDINPRYKLLTISNGNISVSNNTFGNKRASDSYRFNTAQGEITETVLYKDTPKSSKLRGVIYSLHVGSWGGIITKILQFLAAIIAGLLPITGYYLWLKKKF